jgi:branched-chain amino acid transport system substrate-binding protein
MVKKLLMVIAVLALLIPVVGCGPAPAETIKIGCVLTTTGDLGPMGVRMVQGAQLAVDEINAQGGVLGKQVELLVEDDATDPQQHLDRVKKLVEVDGVKALIGAWFGASSGAVAPYAEANKVVVVSPSCTLAPSLLYDQGWREYGFRVALNDGLQGWLLAQIVKDEGYTKAAAIVQDSPYGVGLGEAFGEEVEALKDGGWEGEFVGMVTYDPAKKDYRTELDQIKAWNPDVVLLVSYCEDGVVVLKQASEKEMGIENGIAWLGCDGNYGSGMFKDATAAKFMADSFVAGTRTAGFEGTEYEDFVAAYTADFGEAPEIYCDATYDSAKLIVKAIEQAGVYDSEAIKDAMKIVGQDYHGASGTFSFDENNNRDSGAFEVWEVVEDETAELGYKFVRVKIVEI